MNRRRFANVLRFLLCFSALDLALVVMTGGVSLFGPASSSGFAVRLAIALVLVLAVPSIYSSASPWVGNQPCGAKYPGFCADSNGV